MKMHIFIRVILAGASIIFLTKALAAPSYAQSTRKVVREAAVQQTGLQQTGLQKDGAQQIASPLTLKFDGIDIASFKTRSGANVQRDIQSRVRTLARQSGIETTPAEIDRAAQKIITLLKSDYVTRELSKNVKASVTVKVELTFQPLTTQASFKF